MASSSSSSSPQPLSNPNPQLSRARTFSSSPFLTPHHQELLVERAKRRRQRALRMSREKQIPALALHCAPPLPTFPCSKENPTCFLNHAGGGQFRQNLAFKEAFPPLPNSSPGGGLVIYDGRPLNETLEDMPPFNEYSGGDGDVSEVGSDRGPDLFELRNWRNGCSSSPSSSDEGPLNVTRAASECSADEGTQSEFGVLKEDRMHTKMNDDGCDRNDDLSAEYWKLQADVLAAECNLLRVEKELAFRGWNHGCTQSGVEQCTSHVLKEGTKKDGTLENTFGLSRLIKNTYNGGHSKEPEQEILDTPRAMSQATNCFAHEALRKLNKISDRSSCRREHVEDPTEALQERLQNLLLTAESPILEQGSQILSFPELRLHDAWDKTDMSGARARTIDKRVSRERTLNNRCVAETYTSRKQQGFMSLELSETKAAAAFVRREYRSLLSSESGFLSGESTDQTPGEEMYCKAAIRQIVEQMQAESEQWSQVQEILLSLQEEMGVLIETGELWEERAHQAEAELMSLKEMVHHWRCRAQSVEEEVAVLQSERQALKIKIHSMKQKHAAERRRRSEPVSRANDGVPLPRTDSQPSIGVVLPRRDTQPSIAVSVPRHDTQPSTGVACEVEDQPRHASVGSQEDYALCESIVHSRNESSRSSVDLGTTSQRLFQKSIKKSLDFSNSSIDGNTSKTRVRSHRFGDQILKIEPTRLDFCSKTSDVNSKARHKLSGQLPKVELTRLECVEPVSASEYKERKKARLFTSKENYSKSGPLDAQVAFFAEPFLQKGSLGQVLSVGQDSGEQIILPKPKSAMPSAPTSTPSRLPFAEIFNSPASQ